MEYSPAPHWVKLYAAETGDHSESPARRVKVIEDGALTVMSDIDRFARSENGERSGISEAGDICGLVADLDRKH